MNPNTIRSLRPWHPGHIRRWSSRWAARGAVLAALLFPAAAWSVPAPAASPAAEAAIDAYQLPENPAELLRLDDGMRAFFAARVHRNNTLEGRLDEIVAAILGEQGLHFRYENDGLYDVRETFRRRRGNCVSFAMLVVAVAREYRIAASFNEIALHPRWSRAGALVLESRHLNVVVPHFGARYEIDLNLFGEERRGNLQNGLRVSAREVDDSRAFGGLYSNFGVYRLANGDTPGAFHYLRRATEIEPGFAPAWANLGGAFRRDGDLEQARRCYERALREEPSTMAAICGLAWIHRSTGEIEQAERLERSAARYCARNPYYLLSVARKAFDNGDLELAYQQLSRAIRLKGDEPELFELMVQVLRGLGREREAQRWARRLEQARRPEVVAVAP